MKNKPVILVTNDDGYRAKGFYKLIDLMRNIGEVTAISTECPMSGQSHSITNADPLRFRLLEKNIGCEVYVCNGRPVDCVKLACQVIMNELPDLVVSGINHGSNASINMIYSGTVGAAVEASMDNIAAVAYSLDDYSSDAYFDHLDYYIDMITRKTLKEGLPSGVCLNVNFPKFGDEPIKGVKICRQAEARWTECFDHRIDPHGRDYFWITGKFVEDKNKNVEDTDQYALNNNYVSIVPTLFDMTSYSSIQMLKDWNL